MAKKPINIVMFAVDSLWADHMSCYGYHRLTTPHIDKFAKSGVLFENFFSPHIPTTPGYASMLTGMDCFSTQVVALRHKGGLPDQVATLPEILREAGYQSTCIGFGGNPSSRGFDNYLHYDGWMPDETGKAPKAENLNEVAIPELERLAKSGEPFFLFMRHMDPHSPYLPPPPFDQMFYSGDPCDPSKDSIRPVLEFKPFAEYFKSWMPEGITDADYVIAQYDGAIAYMDACIQRILTRIDELGLAENTLVIINSDHGETLMDHECYFDHHGLYECTLHVPLIMRLPGVLPEGVRIPGISLQQDLVPTILELAGVDAGRSFDGKSLLPLIRGERTANYSEFYITEATWMRKHGWRTPEWKLIVALEPDFHFKPEVELYNLILDPGENHNLAEKEPGIVAALRQRMEAWIEKREKETGKTNPMYTNLQWHGLDRGPFTSSQEAYDNLFIGSLTQARGLQQKK
jgi:Arylsulfatase A and related enzymes